MFELLQNIQCLLALIFACMPAATRKIVLTKWETFIEGLWNACSFKCGAKSLRMLNKFKKKELVQHQKEWYC